MESFIDRYINTVSSRDYRKLDRYCNLLRRNGYRVYCNRHPDYCGYTVVAYKKGN